MIAVAALGIEPAHLRKRLEKCRLAATVFTDEEGDLAAKGHIDSVRESSEVERIGGAIHFLRQALDPVQERRARGLCPWAGPPSRCHRPTMPRGTLGGRQRQRRLRARAACGFRPTRFGLGRALRFALALRRRRLGMETFWQLGAPRLAIPPFEDFRRDLAVDQ